MLSTAHRIFETPDVISYRKWDRAAGVMYTCNGGFLDFGHLFDFVEITDYYHHYLTKGGRNRAGKTIPGLFGEEATIRQDISAADAPTVAASIAFDFSVFYEIMTYWVDGPGQHNSSFSPDDLVSNYIGTRVAERAKRSTIKTFDGSVRAELKAILQLLIPCTTAQTQAAFDAIDGLWAKDVNSGLLTSGFGDDKWLLRRNLNRNPIRPCYVTAAGTGCSGAPAFPSELGTGYPDSIRNTYDARYAVFRSV
jgi:hypothetical protein